MILKLPKNTCPDIDNCIEWVKALAEEAKSDDAFAATRRAIVRAAAEIGKVMS